MLKEEKQNRKTVETEDVDLSKLEIESTKGGKPKTIKVVLIIIAIILMLGGIGAIGYGAYIKGIQENLTGNVEEAAKIQEALTTGSKYRSCGY